MTEPDDTTRVRDLQRLLEISRAMTAARDLDELLGLILDRSMELLCAERATVFLHDAARDELVSRVAMDSEEIRMPAGAGIAGACARSRQIVNVPDAYADERFNRESDARTGFRTRNLLALPLWGCTGKLVGVLEVINKRDCAFGEYDISLAETLAAQAGVVIQRARLLDEYVQKQRMARSLEIAREIQIGLLPKGEPRVEGFDIAGFTDPADETGGDIYDFIPLSDGRLAIVVADATGHGIGPALVVAETRAMLRALSARACDVPKVMSAVNDLLAGDLAEDRFVTCFLGVLDGSANSLTFASAGHGPILFYSRQDDSFQELPATSMPMGIFNGVSFDDTVGRTMWPGDMAVVLTDGLFEAPNPANEQFGIVRICELLRRDRNLPSREALGNIHAAVLDWSGGQERADDLTGVLVRKLI